jgi:hypothetical protein
MVEMNCYRSYEITIAPGSLINQHKISRKSTIHKFRMTNTCSTDESILSSNPRLHNFLISSRKLHDTEHDAAASMRASLLARDGQYLRGNYRHIRACAEGGHSRLKTKRRSSTSRSSFESSSTSTCRRAIADQQVGEWNLSNKQILQRSVRPRLGLRSGSRSQTRSTRRSRIVSMAWARCVTKVFKSPDYLQG